MKNKEDERWNALGGVRGKKATKALGWRYPFSASLIIIPIFDQCLAGCFLGKGENQGQNKALEHDGDHTLSCYERPVIFDQRKPGRTHQNAFKYRGLRNVRKRCAIRQQRPTRGSCSHSHDETPAWRGLQATHPAACM